MGGISTKTRPRLTTQIQRIWYIKCRSKKHDHKEDKPVIGDGYRKKIDFINWLKSLGWKRKKEGFVCPKCQEKMTQYKVLKKEG